VIDDLFWWVGAVVCGLGAFAAVGAAVMALLWVILDHVLRRLGLTYELILAAGQRRREREAMLGDGSALRDAHDLLNRRVAEYRAKHKVKTKDLSREVDP
jgi:hypothetical protein